MELFVFLIKFLGFSCLVIKFYFITIFVYYLYLIQILFLITTFIIGSSILVHNFVLYC